MRRGSSHCDRLPSGDEWLHWHSGRVDILAPTPIRGKGNGTAAQQVSAIHRCQGSACCKGASGTLGTPRVVCAVATTSRSHSASAEKLKASPRYGYVAQHSLVHAGIQRVHFKRLKYIRWMPAYGLRARERERDLDLKICLPLTLQARCPLAHPRPGCMPRWAFCVAGAKFVAVWQRRT